MAPRSLEERSQELQANLEELLNTAEVYYNPPMSVQMSYPAVVYNRSNIDNGYANDAVYMQSYRYELTVISEDPDCEYVDKISRLPTCTHERAFIADNLYHNVFNLYY